MRSAKSTGRTVGALLFVQLVGLTLPFILLMPIVTPDFLEIAAGISPRIRTAVLLLFANGAVTIGIAIASFPVLRESSYRAALWLLAFSILWLALQAVDNALILSMLSVSEQYAQGGASSAGVLGTLGAVVRSAREWAHYTELLVIDCWFLVFYGVLFRQSLVPRALAGFAVAMAVVHTVAVPLPMFLDYGSMPLLAPSLALSHLALGTWLVVKGLEERHHRVPAEARPVELASV